MCDYGSYLYLKSGSCTIFMCLQIFNMIMREREREREIEREREREDV